MATGKPFSKQVVTPKAVAKYPWLNKPDTRFGGAHYKVNLEFEGDEGQKFYEQVEAIAEEALAHQKVIDPAYKKIKSLKLPIEPAEDEEGNEIEGKYVMKIKSNAFIATKDGETLEMKPKLVDAMKQPFSGAVFGGSIIKCAIQLVPYSGFGGGLTARLNAVQVLKAVEGNSATDMFEEEEDYASNSNDDVDTPDANDDF